MAHFSLNLNGPFIKLPEELASNEPTHISRYWITGSFIKQLADQLKIDEPSILDVGGLNGLLPEFGFTNRIELDVQPIQKPNYVQGSALDMQFEDNSFDFVVACDVFEHIAGADREKFLQELHRVAKHFVIFCAPFDHPGVPEAERWANDFYKRLSGKDHPWLIEHIENKLPKEDEVNAFLSGRNISFARVRHLSLENWRMILQLDLLRVVHGDNNSLQKHAHAIYSEYLKNQSMNEFIEDGYRTFYAFGKDIELQLIGQNDKPSGIISSASAHELLDLVTELCVKRYNQPLDQQITET